MLAPSGSRCWPAIWPPTHPTLLTTDQIQAPIDDLNLLLDDLARAEGDVSHGPVGGTVAESAGNP